MPTKQDWKRYLTNFKKELTSNEENGTDFFAYISVISPTTLSIFIGKWNKIQMEVIDVIPRSTEARGMMSTNKYLPYLTYIYLGGL